MKDMKWYKSITVKLLLGVVGTIVVTNGLLAYMYMNIQEAHLNETLHKTASHLSETIKKSVRYDMLTNSKEHAYRIMEAIGQQDGIEKVRIYSGEGRIIFSSDRSETGLMVRKEAEACNACHSSADPEARLSPVRTRIFSSTERHKEASRQGHRVLGMVNPLYNDKECAGAPCHAHPATQRVLGVIDVSMSLEDIDKGMAAARRQVFAFNLVTILALSAVTALVLFRFVESPVKELVLGTRLISGGDLEHVIPVTGDDEMGHLAASFNQMTRNLRKAHAEIQDLIRDLEKKVDERTKELKETQSQLLHSEKLAALGRLAATVAHEINNPLTGVFTYIKLIERKIDRGGINPEDVQKYKEFLAVMRREVERTTSIVQNLLDFTRPKEPIRKPIGIVRIVEESLALIQNQIKISNIEVVNQMSPLPDVMADPSQIKQAVLNVLVNACEAMEGGGTLTLSSRYDEERKMVTLGICDTGVGIPSENMARVFDPFFTTKEKGTGLGLSVVHGIIVKHNGLVEVKSRPGRGTLIKIRLPVE
jgi:two-component system NtrC family sensor kinase